jgi:1-deoxy-D-xylulose-5-phosphate reductoisomerase
MTKKISILGSTGSVGVQSVEVARHLGLKILGLTSNTNIDLLERQAREFKPKIVAVRDENLAYELSRRLEDLDIEVCFGTDGITKVATIDDVDTVVVSVVGSAGLLPTLGAIRMGKRIALANKETLVMAGSIVMSEAAKYNAEIIPVDSEHSAIFQCLMGNDGKGISKIILTASGGAFRGRSKRELTNVTLAEALNHPNWKMGSKITIDSATLMNKGLEVIEARWLFDVAFEQIQVVIHPQSVIHSAVEYIDGSVIAQLGSTDMRLPIHFAFTYPNRATSSITKLNLLETGMLTFDPPDLDTFSCLRLAFEAARTGGTMPAVLNAANEIAVSLFLNEKIGFLDIPRLVEGVMGKHTVITDPTLNEILNSDCWAREMAEEIASSR